MNKHISNALGIVLVIFFSLCTAGLYSAVSSQVEALMLCRDASGFQYWLDNKYENKDEAPQIVSSRLDNSVLQMFGKSSSNVSCTGTALTKDGRYVSWAGGIERLNVGDKNGTVIGHARMLND